MDLHKHYRWAPYIIVWYNPDVRNTAVEWLRQNIPVVCDSWAHVVVITIQKISVYVFIIIRWRIIHKLPYCTSWIQGSLVTCLEKYAAYLPFPVSWCNCHCSEIHGGNKISILCCIWMNSTCAAYIFRLRYSIILALTLLFLAHLIWNWHLKKREFPAESNLGPLTCNLLPTQTKSHLRQPFRTPYRPMLDEVCRLSARSAYTTVINCEI